MYDLVELKWNGAAADRGYLPGQMIRSTIGHAYGRCCRCGHAVDRWRAGDRPEPAARHHAAAAGRPGSASDAADARSATPGYVTAKELPDGAVPPPDADGNFIIGPTHNPAPEMTRAGRRAAGHGLQLHDELGRQQDLSGHRARRRHVRHARSRRSGEARRHDQPSGARTRAASPSTCRSSTSPAPPAPFIVGADGPDQLLFTALDNLIAQKRVPVMIAISIGNGSGDAQGSQRGLEYDTMSGRYAEFVETEVLPLVEKQYNVKLTKDPEGRATMGGSSGGSAALIMAWYHPELYHRVLTYSGTYVNQQWPPNAETPHGAWEFHEQLIPNSPAKPIRIWMEVGDRDLLNPNVMRDDMHDWVVANENMARVLAAKGYHYQFVFARNAGHTDRTVKQQTLPAALEWLWRGYPAANRP